MVLDTPANQVADEHHGAVVIGAGFGSAFSSSSSPDGRKLAFPSSNGGATTRMIGSSNAAQTAISGTRTVTPATARSFARWRKYHDGVLR